MTKHNILARLIETIGEKNLEIFLKVAEASNLPKETQAYAINQFQEHIKKREAGEFSNLTTPVYSYIPNFKDMPSTK